MEVLGAIASIVALLETGKKLRECVARFPKHQRRIQDVAISIHQYLESLHELAQSHKTRPEIDALALRDATFALEADLQSALSRCLNLSKSLSRYGWFRRAIWKDSDDLEAELIRVEQRISHCCRRFSITGVARVELSLIKIASMTDQLRAEVLHRLDSVEEHLRARVESVDAGSMDARTLIGINKMSSPELESALEEAAEELNLHSSATLESDYLHLKVETLTEAVERLPVDGDTHTSPISRSTSGTHISPVDDPAEQTEDVIMSTMRILRALRQRDSSAPVTQIAADLESLSMGLLDLGMNCDAHKTYQQVVRIYRGSNVHTSRSPILDPRVARALVGVSVCLQRLGRANEGLDPLREAATIFRSLESTQAGQFRRELALTLTNISQHLRSSGSYIEAKISAIEALEYRRQLVLEFPDSQPHKADLAVALHNTSICCSKTPGHETEASAYALESVSLNRELTVKSPGVYLRYLGASLHNAANRQTNTTDAYRIILEALLIRRALAISRPHVYGEGLVKTLFVATKLAFHRGDIVAMNSFQKEQERWSKSGSTMRHPLTIMRLLGASTSTNTRDSIGEGPEDALHFETVDGIPVPSTKSKRSESVDEVFNSTGLNSVARAVNAKFRHRTNNRSATGSTSNAYYTPNTPLLCVISPPGSHKVKQSPGRRYSAAHTGVADIPTLAERNAELISLLSPESDSKAENRELDTLEELLISRIAQIELE